MQLQPTIVLERASRLFASGDHVRGHVRLPQGSSRRSGALRLRLTGSVHLTLSPVSIGLFEALYNSMQPISLVDVNTVLSCPFSTRESDEQILIYPFDVKIEPREGNQLLSSYHGVYISVKYIVECELKSMLPFSNKEKSSIEIFVNCAPDVENFISVPVQFNFEPDSLSLSLEKSKHDISIHGHLSSTDCLIKQPLMGELTVRRSSIPIKSIELRLQRIESCEYTEGDTREASEVLCLEIAQGDVMRDIPIPICMRFPPLLTCASINNARFSVNFVLRLCVNLEDGESLIQRFPLRLF